MHLFQNFGCNYSRFYWQAAPIDNPNWSLGASRSNHLWLPSTPSPSSISISTSLSTPRRIDIPIRSPGVQCTLCAVQCTRCTLCAVCEPCASPWLNHRWLPSPPPAFAPFLQIVFVSIPNISSNQFWQCQDFGTIWSPIPSLKSWCLNVFTAMNDFSLVFVVVGMHLKTAKKQQINSGSHWVFTLWIAHFLNKYGSLQLEQEKQ